MERSLWLKAAILICCFLLVSGGREIKVKNDGQADIYNHTLATILVEYASAVYMSDLTELFTWTCSRCKDKTEGFEIIDLIVDVQNCLQAFVGMAADLNSIIIAFRGTQEHSIQNWIEDLFWKQLDLNYPGVSDAMVHHGFYSAYHNTTLRPGILKAVHRAKKFYGDVGIMVTGHSMGGAMASFCALDLTVHHGEDNVQLMTFGQPRIGNAVFASYLSKHVPRAVRVINEHDMVPHLPPYYTYFPQKTYHHFPREVWIYNLGFGSLVYSVEKVCDSSGEDPSCCRSVPGNSISDHLVYFGVNLQAKTWGSCGIVMGEDMMKYQTDLNGAIILSREPLAAPILELEKQMDSGVISV
uniref:Lipase n=1 Tax=Anthurium amnicola TaxID=1678845 RepID=A0A1D1Y170_9ARAE